MIENPLFHFLERFYERLIKWSSNLQSLFLFWMRITWGPQFFVMGLQKLTNLSQSIDLFQGLGYSHPLFHTYLTGYIELIGGAALVLGLCTRLIAIPLVLTTCAILIKAHATPISEWTVLTNPSLISHQPPYPFLIVALLVLIFGPGKISLDAWIKRRIHRNRHLR